MGIKFGNQFNQFKIGGDGERGRRRAAGPLRHSQQSGAPTSVKKAGATQRVDVAAVLHQLQVKRLSCGCRSGPALTRADRGRHASFGRPLRLQSATLQTTRVSAVAGCRRGTAQTTWLEGDCLLTCLGTCLLACLHPNQRYPKWFMCTRFRRSATRRTKHFVERQRVHRTIVDSTMCHCHLRSFRAHFRDRFNFCKHDRRNSCRAPTRIREFL